jgi:SAV_6107-like HEPN
MTTNDRTVPARSVPRPGLAAPARGVLEHARAVLAEATVAESAAERFRLAHLSALRTAAAVFAERARPATARRRLVSAWVLVESVAPEFGEWAGYFAAGAAARAAVEAGAVSAVTSRDADDQLRAAGEFLALVEDSLGLLAAPLAS